MSDSVRIQAVFPKYDSYEAPLKSFISFFMCYANLYMKLAPKNEATIVTNTLTAEDVTYDGENESIEVSLNVGALTGNLKAKLEHCTIEQIAASLELEEDEDSESTTYILDGIYSVTDEGKVVIQNIVPPDEGYQWSLITDGTNPTAYIIPECDLFSTIKLGSTRLPFTYTMDVGGHPIEINVESDEVCVPFSNSYKGTTNSLDGGIINFSTQFITTNTSLSLYDLSKDSSTYSAAYNSNFSIPCRIIPNINNEVNTDTNYIPYSIFDFSNLQTLTIPIPDNDNFTFQLRTSSFAVKDSSDNSLYDVFYKVGICSLDGKQISTDALITKLLDGHSIYIKDNNIFNMATLFFSDWYDSVLSVCTIEGINVPSNDTSNTLQQIVVIPLYNVEHNETTQSETRTLVGVMYAQLCEDSTGTLFSLDFELSNEVYYDSTSAVNNFYLTFTDKMTNEHIPCAKPSLSTIAYLPDIPS